MKLTIKVKPLYPHCMPKIIAGGDWIDLKLAEDVCLSAPKADRLKQKDNIKTREVVGEVTYLSLGIAVKLPKGCEALMVSRSSTPKKYGIIQANSVAVIDEKFCGNDDIWQFPAIPIRATRIKQGTRICQFRIQLSQKASFWQKLRWLFSSGIRIKEVTDLKSENRGGLGSTGEN